MAVLRVSACDPVADRRADYAEGLAARGEFDAAIEVMSGALELVPGWAAGWYRLGEYCELAGKPSEALAAYDRVTALDPADRFGARLKRDLLRKTPAADSMPPAFVELLFDQYAPQFEASLVGKLAYRGPSLILAELERAGFTRARRALDLGCGTGLMGEVLRARVDWLAGYDISAGMLAEAASKAIYDALDKRDCARMEIDGERFDLIVAADVFAYIGALEQVIGWCAASLESGGFLAFTVEAGDAPVTLQESRRFAHSREYVEGLLRDAGFVGVRVSDCVVRQDRGADIASLCVTASAPIAEVRPRRMLEGEAEA